MGAWDEPAESPDEPKSEDTTQPAEPEAPITPDDQSSEVESPPVEGTPEGEVTEQEATEDDEVRDDVPLAEIDTKFSNSPKGARSYITRLTERLEQAKDAVEFEKNFLASKPADELLNSLAEKSTSRYSDLGFAYWRAHKDQFLQEEFGLSAADLKQRLETAPTDTNGREVPQDDLDPDDLDDLPTPIKAKLQEYDALKAKVPDLESRLQKFEQTQQETVQQTIEREQEVIREGVIGQIRSHAAEHIAERLGLKAEDGDSPEIVQFIKDANQTLLERMFNDFGAKPEYEADAESIIDAITRRDKKRALSYVPKAKVAAELVLDQIAKPSQAALRAMRSKPTQKPSPQPPIVNGQSGSFIPSDNLVRGKGVEALWGE